MESSSAEAAESSSVMAKPCRPLKGGGGGGKTAVRGLPLGGLPSRADFADYYLEVGLVTYYVYLAVDDYAHGCGWLGCLGLIAS